MVRSTGGAGRCSGLQRVVSAQTVRTVGTGGERTVNKPGEGPCPVGGGGKVHP